MAVRRRVAGRMRAALLISRALLAAGHFACVTHEQEREQATCEPPCRWKPIEMTATPECVALQAQILRIQRRIAENDVMALDPPLSRTMESLEFMMSDVFVQGVEGGFMETGVWTGRHSLMIAASLKAHNALERDHWLCDSFNGLPPPKPKQWKADKNDRHYGPQCAVRTP